MKLTIDRDKWLRGTGDGALYLGGAMCCLGFLGRACGIGVEDLYGIGCPSGLQDGQAKKHRKVWELMNNSLETPRKVLDDLASDVEAIFIAINDSTLIGDKKRERLLTKEFAKIGVEVEFVGGKEVAR